MIYSSRWFLIITLLASHLLLGCDATEQAPTSEAEPTTSPVNANPASERSPNHRLAAKYKLPKFDTESPKFCVWNFPRDNGTHEVLVAWDDNVLYCDRNGNRDLTEPNERIDRTVNKHLPKGYRQFEVDEIVVGNKSHLSTILSILTSDRSTDDNSQKNVQTNGFSITSQIQTDRFRGLGVDGRVKVSVAVDDFAGKLEFGKSIEDAPTINFLGELQIRMSGKAKLRPGGADQVYTLIGTNGDGRGTFAYLQYQDVIPENAYPTITFKTDSGPLADLQLELLQRC